MAYKNEKGRSMVEILGVLAVMGVITLGGIWQYRQAMDRHIADEVVFTIRTVATTASIQVSLEKEINLDEYDLHKMIPYPLSAVKANNGTFAIIVSEVPKNVCSHIMQTKWDFPHKKSVNGIQSGECDMDENIMAFDFYDTLEKEQF